MNYLSAVEVPAVSWLEIFTTRELAVGFWSIIALIWALRYAKIGRSLFGVLTHVLRPKLLSPILILAGYTAALVLLLAKADFWNLGLLKDTIFWFFFSGLAVAFSGVLSENAEMHFRQLIRQQLSVLLLLEFVINTYTFSLIVELIVLPVMTGLVLIEAVADYTPGSGPVKKAAGCLSATLGLVALTFVLARVIAELGSVQWASTARELILPLILTMCALPFGFVVLVLTRYETLFVRIRTKDAKLRRAAKWRLVRQLGFSLRRIDQFMHEHTADLVTMRTRADLDRVLPPH